MTEGTPSVMSAKAFTAGWTMARHVPMTPSPIAATLNLFLQQTNQRREPRRALLALPIVLQEHREVPPREEHGERDEEDPEDRHLVEQLPDEAQSGVEVRRRQADHDEEDPYQVDARIHESSVALEQVDQQRRKDEEKDVAELAEVVRRSKNCVRFVWFPFTYCVDEFGNYRGKCVVVFAPIDG